MVKFQAHAVATAQLASDGQALQKQGVHLLVGVEVVRLVLGALVGDVVAGELPKCPQGNVRAADVQLVAPVPEGLDLHQVLDTVAAAQVTAEQRCEHVPVAECGFGLTTFPEGGVYGPAQPAVVKLLENGKKSPERVDVVGF